MNNSERKTILVLSTTFPRWHGDTEPDFVYELSSRLTGAFEIHVLAPHFQGAKKYELFDGMHVHRYQYFLEQFQMLAYQGGILANLKKAKWIYVLVPFLLFFQLLHSIRLIKKYDIDIIHAHWIFPQGFIGVLVRFLTKKSVKIVVTSHGGDLFGLRGAFFKWTQKNVLSSVDRITVVSQYMKDHIAQHFKRQIAQEYVNVISMGVELNNVFVPNTERVMARNSLIFVGRLVPKKGLHVLLHALYHLKSEGHIYSLQIIGDGPERNRLEAQCADLDISSQVEFLGAKVKSQLPDYLQRSECAVFPFVIDANGDQEGLGLVVVEAIGCGCTVVVSNLGAIADVIPDDCICHVKAESGNYESLADAIKTASKSAYSNSKQCADFREKIKNKFDWDVIAEHYTELFYSLYG